MDENSTLLAVSETEKFITNYKAVYQAMTAKHDCKSKIFPRNVIVEIEDIRDLNERIVEKLKNYRDAGFAVSVIVSFNGRQTMEFSSWQEFDEHRWDESDAINSITIIWEFNAVLPQFEVPQQHVLVVKITDGLRPQEMLNIVFAGKLENIEDIDNQMYPVVARVDFINYILGDELLRIVEEWNKGLKSQKDKSNKTGRFVKKNRRKIAFALNYITRFILLVCSIKILCHLFVGFNLESIANLTTKNVCDTFWVVGILLVVATLFNKLSEWLSNIFFRTLDQGQEQHVFSINKGDLRIQDTIDRQIRQNYLSIIGSVVGTVLIDIVSAVICSFIVK